MAFFLDDKEKFSNSWQDEDVLMFPASIIQQQFWLINQLHPDSPAYNIPSLFRLKGLLTRLALEKSINGIIRRHEVFRTTFTTINGEPFQIIAPQLCLDLPVIDLSSRPKSELDVEVQRLVSKEVIRPFDLSSGPLIRAQLLRLSDEEHLFLIVMHHIITDLHTKDQFAIEFSILYDAFLTNKPSPLAEPVLQYSHYAVWQQEWLKGEEFSSMLSYWEQQLKEKSVFLDLPTDRKQPALQSLNGAEQPVSLPRSLTDDLKQFSRREKVNIFITLLSAFLVLLHKYSRQLDITVGVPLTNRRQREYKDIMGCFVNILPISINFSGDPNFQEVIHRVRKAMLGAHRHQEVPYESIVKELKPKRDFSYNPLFQVGFTFEPPMELDLKGLTVETLSIHNGGAQLDVFTTLWDTKEGIRGRFEYNTDLFDGATMIRFAGHYLTLLKAIIAVANQPVSQLPILTDYERKQIIFEWNDTRVDYPQDLCIHQLFEAQAEQTPDAVAVLFEKQKITYRQLNSSANRLAHHLQKLGVSPEVRVGVLMEHSVDMIVGLLGILKAGGAYVPLDPDYPQERLLFMINDARISVLLMQKHLISRMPVHRAKVVCLDSLLTSIDQDNVNNPISRISAENLAYVIYTSGSTGSPKGVAIEHRNAGALLYWAKNVYSKEELSGVLASTSICFDLSVFEIFVPLSWGGTVILIHKILQVSNTYEKDRITLINTVPSVMTELLRADNLPEGIETVNLAGEPLQTSIVNELYEQSRVQKVYDLYGPSEDTTYSIFTLRKSEGPPIIGRPIANTQVYILDSNMQAVPIGVTGELFIGGDGVARGYLNRPDLTAERFLRNPFSDEPGSRLYKTGDLARYLPDGNIEFQGRIDHQVKVRGFRIELGEIESVLSQHPAVREAVVLAREDVPDDKRLVAYVVSNQQSPLSISELRNFLKEKLPDYMVPAAFVPLETLPLTPNGKVNRRALPAPESERQSEEAYVAPQNELEKIIAGIWQELLQVEKVGVHDNFFDLGGHSLLIVQAHSRLHEVVDRELSLTDMFRYPTIEKLTKYLTQEQNEELSLEKIHDRARKQKETFIRQRQLVNKITHQRN